MLVATRDREVSPMRVTELLAPRFAPPSTPIDADAPPLVVSTVVL
jgi:hypothetical protein